MEPLGELALELRQRRGRYSPAALFAEGGAGAWYDASDLGAMFADAAGTVAAVVGGPVGRIEDRSGRGNHAVQPVAAARPTLRRGANGRCFLDFDGVDDHLVAGDLTISQPLSAVVAGTIEGAADYQRFFDSAPGSAARVTIGKQGAATMIGFAGTLGLEESGAAFPAGPDVWSALFAGPASSLRRGGIQRGAGDAGGAGLAGLTIGAGAYPAGSGEYLRGRLYGLAIVAGAIADFTAAEAWLARRAGL